MIKSKKGIVIEALMRIIIMIVLVVIVFNIGKRIANTFFGGDSNLKSFDNFFSEINSLDDGGKEVFLSMDEGTAVIGFSKNAKEFRCYGCEQVYNSKYSDKLLYYSIKKPSNEYCNGKTCVCLCLKGFRKSPYSGDESKINCESFSCKELKQDIYSKISLEEALKKKGMSIAVYPYWENGFFYVRSKNTETPLNGMFPPNDIMKTTLYIEKKKINDNVYLGACPLLPCIQEQK